MERTHAGHTQNSRLIRATNKYEWTSTLTAPTRLPTVTQEIQVWKPQLLSQMAQFNGAVKDIHCRRKCNLHRSDAAFGKSALHFVHQLWPGTATHTEFHKSLTSVLTSNQFYTQQLVLSRRSYRLHTTAKLVITMAVRNRNHKLLNKTTNHLLNYFYWDQAFKICSAGRMIFPPFETFTLPRARARVCVQRECHA
jgi:hypothetical protein